MKRFNLYRVTFKPNPRGRHRSPLANQPDGSHVYVMAGEQRAGLDRVFGVGEFRDGKGVYPVESRHTCELIGTTLSEIL